MKNLSFSLALANLFLFSCEDCDDATPVDNPNAQFVATYRLTALVPPVPVDSNGDGTHSQNLLHESDCYNGSFLTLNGDGTYRIRHNAAIVNEGETNCDTETTTGNWTAAGNSIALSSGEEVHHFTYSGETGSLTHQRELQYPHVTDEGELVALNAEVEHVFTK